MEPRRLTEQGNPFEKELLHSGRRDAMPEQSGRSILVGLGLAPHTAAAAGAAAGGKLLFVKSVLVVAGVGAAGVFAVWGGERLLSAPEPAASAALSQREAPPLVIAPPPPAAPEPVAPAVSTPPEAAPAPARTSRRTVTTRADTLPLELEVLDKARSALASGNAALASQLLDRYAARFPKPRLRTEATVLRIEVLVARGERQSARRIGKAFLSSHPTSPYARRVRSLIGDKAMIGDRR